MTTLHEVRGFIDRGEYYNARIAIESLGTADEIEGELLKIELFVVQSKWGPALDTARTLLRPDGEELAPTQRIRALLGAARAARTEEPEAVEAFVTEARTLTAGLAGGSKSESGEAG